MALVMWSQGTVHLKDATRNKQANHIIEHVETLVAWHLEKYKYAQLINSR